MKKVCPPHRFPHRWPWQKKYTNQPCHIHKIKLRMLIHNIHCWILRCPHRNKIFALSILLLLLVTAVSAHQPRLVDQDFTEIKNPEISQAFYGNLEGKEESYQINSGTPFMLYVQILVPDIENIDKDVSANITLGEKTYTLDGLEHEWTRFYEEFGGDYYYMGPEMEQAVKQGTYNIKVFSPDNQGKYVLVVGKEEAFPVKEMLRTLVVMPKLKMYFDRSPFTAFFNRIGIFLLIPLIILIVIIFFLRWLIKKLYTKT
ncbi:hypothetical protein KY335_02305 [Candidatus Woesearchaeota archaeon]|nr:hypothetical protein [Candidatus Woesearchaeota archaeon]